jgi:hypothetical protein
VSCADLDGDDLRGIVRVELSLHDVRTMEPFVGVITPEQEVDATGRYLTTIEVRSASRQFRTSIRTWWALTY